MMSYSRAHRRNQVDAHGGSSSMISTYSSDDLDPASHPLVSVIIPTHRRPELLRLAVLSVLAQTYANVEVVVVSDGPDPPTAAVMSNLDPRVLYLELPVNQGPAAARNFGILHSHGEWIAFLDDDDEFLPRKLEAQVALADPNQPHIMISCRSIYRHSGRDDVWPERPIAPDEDIADYILIRKSLIGRPGIVSIHCLLVHRSILQSVPFTNWKDHEDWSWLLEAWHRAGARLRFVWEPLVIYNISVEGISRSRRMNWQDSAHWVDAHRQWISNRAFRSFAATKIALKARRAGDWKGLAHVSSKVLRAQPTLLDLAFLAGMALLPSRLLNMAWKRSLNALPAQAPQ
jgi:glycosyltransferase involved in cell wall biosynthesis